MPGWISANGTGVCPYCKKGVQFIVHEPDIMHMPIVVERMGSREPAKKSTTSAVLEARRLSLKTAHCPLCSNLIMELHGRAFYAAPGSAGHPVIRVARLLPASEVREPPDEVENAEIRRDYQEAHAVANLSTRGAAALARRSLQHALRDRGFTHPKARLYDEIELAAESKETPASLKEKLHFIRKVGANGAHPNLDHAGEIIDVTEAELEMLFETLNEFFEVYYVRPARHAAVMKEQEARKKGQKDA